MNNRFDNYLMESEAADAAHKLGLTAAGYGLWRDKDGKIVKKTVEGKLKDVRGSAANIKHYHSNIPASKQGNHAEHDMSSDIVADHETEGAHRESEVSKYHIIEHSSVHPKNAAKLHDTLVGSGYKHSSSPFGQMYKHGKTAVMISNRPEVSHKRGGKDKDHHSIVIQTEHAGRKKDDDKKKK
jgi:hypothetical protein